MISVALKTPLKTRLEICIYIISLPHRPDDYIGFTSSCPPTFYNKIAPMHVAIMTRPCGNHVARRVTREGVEKRCTVPL